MCQVWCSGIQGIYAQLQGGQSAICRCALFSIYIDLPLDVPSLVQQYSRHLCFFEGEGSASRSDYICQVWCSSIQGIYAQLKGAMCHGYMCIVLYMKLIWCNGFAEIYAQLEGSGGSISHKYMCILLYIYRSAMRCGKFGVPFCTASMLNWRRGGVNLP